MNDESLRVANIGEVASKFQAINNSANFPSITLDTETQTPPKALPLTASVPVDATRAISNRGRKPMRRWDVSLAIVQEQGRCRCDVDHED